MQRERKLLGYQSVLELDGFVLGLNSVHEDAYAKM